MRLVQPQHKAAVITEIVCAQANTGAGALAANAVGAAGGTGGGAVGGGIPARGRRLAQHAGKDGKDGKGKGGSPPAAAVSACLCAQPPAHTLGSPL